MLRPCTFAAVLALVAVPAFAQTTEPGAGKQPMSTAPTNVAPSSTHTLWSPSLPTPAVPENAPPAAFIKAAQAAIAAGKLGEAQEAIERAESRALDRSVRPTKAGQPSRQPLVQQLAQARQALGNRDKAGASRMLEQALANPDARETED